MYGLPYDNGKISIHTLRMEGDGGMNCFFLVKWISIHTLRMEGDLIIS